MKQLAFLFAISLCILSQSCHVGTSGTWKNDRIDQNVKTEIGSLNKKLINAIIAKDANAVKQLMSPKLAEKSGRGIDTLTNTYSKPFKAANYEVMDEYYTKSTASSTTNLLLSNNGNNHDYQIKYLAMNDEMYASVLISKSFPVSVIVLAIYGKYDDTWKLNILQVGEYSILDKAAPDYYTAALKYDKQGDIIDAANMILTASEIVNPLGKYFKYQNEAAINELYTKVLKEADDKYQFPIEVDKVKTKPQIFAVTPQLIDGGKNKGIFPIIKYKSAIQLTDTLALKKENREIQQTIGDVFKGIDMNNSHIVYQVFDQVPNGTTPVKHHGFVQTTASH